VHWAVVDPRRHTLDVWQKTGDSYTDAGRELGASLFTNGPFGSYPGGSRYRSTVGAATAFLRTGLKEALSPGPAEPALWLRCARRFYSGESPDGHVISSSRAIVETRNSRPRLLFFGREGGRWFEHYRIGQGDPPLEGSFVGGLFRATRDYQACPADRDDVVGNGIWGLAPLDGADRHMIPSGIKESLEAYNDATSGQPVPPCTGVIVVLCCWGQVAAAAEMLVRARVRDAVRIDGNNSLLFGHGRTVVVGERMPLRKQLLQSWGLGFWAH